MHNDEFVGEFVNGSKKSYDNNKNVRSGVISKSLNLQCNVIL